MERGISQRGKTGGGREPRSDTSVRVRVTAGEPPWGQQRVEKESRPGSG